MAKNPTIWLTLAATFVLSVCSRYQFYRFLLGLELLLILAAWLELRYWKGKIRLSLALPQNRVYTGQPFPVLVRCENDASLPTSRLRATVLLKDLWSGADLTAQGVFQLDGKEKGSLQLSFTPSYSGVYHVTLQGLECWDHLGLFRHREAVKDYTQTLCVLPENPERTLLELDLGREEGDGGLARLRSGESPVETYDIRAYRQGEPVRRIHWKISVKKMELMVRELGEPMDAMNRIYLNLQASGKSERSQWENFLRTAYSFSLSLLSAQRPHFVCWVDIDQGTMAEYQVRDEMEAEQMLCGLLYAKTWQQGEKTGVLGEIVWNETAKENIEINLQGEIIFAGREG